MTLQELCLQSAHDAIQKWDWQVLAEDSLAEKTLSFLQANPAVEVWPATLAVFFRVLYDALQPKHVQREVAAQDLFNYAYLRAKSLGGNTLDIEECAQDATFRVIRKLLEVKNPQAFWGVVNNCIRHAVQAQLRIKELISIDDDRDKGENKDDEPLPIVSSIGIPDWHATCNDLRERIVLRFAQISAKFSRKADQLKAFALEFFWGMDNDEVADKLKRSKTQVEQLKARATEFLRSDLIFTELVADWITSGCRDLQVL